jgi:ubiquinone/menaquinone biosynthesis C-methylase UbiE
MEKTRPNSPDEISDALRLQRGIYSSRNPTREWLHNSRLQWLTEAIRRYFPAGSKGPAIDIGTGCGILLPALSRQFTDVISMDIETEFLHQARIRMETAGNIQYVTGDVRALPVRDNTAEVVLCAEVLEHIRNDRACLREMYRALKPGGILVLSTPQPGSLLEMTARIILRRPMLPLARKIYREPVQPTGHINLISARRLGRKLAQAGFTVLETYKSGLYLPGLAEIPARSSQKIAAALNTRLSNTMLDFLLWTQFFVACKPTAGRTHTRPAKERP